MLTVRKEQFDDLEKFTRQAFHERLYIRLANYHCNSIKKQNKASVLEKMALWHQRGIDYGLDSKKAMGRFLGLHLTLVPDYDLGQPVQEVLRNSEMNGDQKMTALFFRLRQLNQNQD